MRKTARQPLVALIAVVACAGCGTSGSVVHLIPEGYEGPVIVIFDDPAGIVPGNMNDDEVVYQIPSNGILKLNAPAPEPGFYTFSYFYVASDGTRFEIPYHADIGTRQVFADVVGVAGEHRWYAYIVGVPNARVDWALERSRATANATGVSGAQ